MSIIERVLERGREERQRDGSRADAVGARRGEVIRSAVKSRVDSALRVIALSVTADEEECRERRILLDEHAVADRAALAAYRRLSGSLQGLARQRNWITIGITSAGAGEGTTLTAVNLALAISREKSREVVLLDCNFANPGVCRALGIYPSYELGGFLESGAHLRELFFSVGEPSLLIAGNTEPMAGDAAPDFKPRLEELVRFVRRGTIDPIVLVDLPATGTSAGVAPVAAMLDAVLLVAREERTAPADVARAIDALRTVPVAGVVLNAATVSE